MASARDQMKMIEAELERVRSEIERLRIEESVYLQLQAKLSGVPAPIERTRTRSPSVKPVVLDIMNEMGPAGATTTEVEQRVRMQVPSVAKDTVASVLSRLKSDGALVYEGERYFEKRYAPVRPDSPFERGVRTVM